MSRQPASPRPTEAPSATAYTAAGRSHRGQVRKVNEDAWIALPERGLFAVIDGMGGARAGAKAAALAREALESKLIRTSGDLRSAFERGHEAISAHAAAHPEDEGLGCVATAALLRGSRLTLAHVGDTRAYLATRAGCEQLTRDHTVVAELQERHVMTEDAADSLPGQHRVTRDLGSGARMGGAWIDLGEGELADGDLLLLASDGLTDLVSSGEIARLLGQTRQEPGSDLDRLAERLIELTLERGAHDNVTVVVVRREVTAAVDDTDTISLPVPVRRPRLARAVQPARSSWRLTALVGIASLGLGGLVGWLARRPPAAPVAQLAPPAPGPLAADALAVKLAGSFETDATWTALEPIRQTAGDLTTEVAEHARVVLRGLDLGFDESAATWTVHLAADAQLTLQQASLRAPGAHFVALLEAGARLRIVDSHVDVKTFEARGAAGAAVEIQGGRFTADDITSAAEGPTILIEGTDVSGDESTARDSASPEPKP